MPCRILVLSGPQFGRGGQLRRQCLADIQRADELGMMAMPVAVEQRIDFGRDGQREAVGQGENPGADNPAFHLAIADAQLGGGDLHIGNNRELRLGVRRGQPLLHPQVEVTDAADLAFAGRIARNDRLIGGDRGLDVG
jgi:hypothetical protein